MTPVDDQTGELLVPHTEPMSNGEIARSLARIEKSIETMSGKLDNRPTHEDLERVEKGLDCRIEDLENWNTWAQRIIIGAVLMALLGVVLITGAGPLG